MTWSGDHLSMRRRRTLDDRSAEALLSGRAVDGEPELTAFVAALSAEAVAVEPSIGLAILLAEGFVPDVTTVPVAIPRAARPGVRRWALQASLGAAACVAVSVGAAANDLPAPVQRTVANVVEALTPLTVPRPAEDHSPAVTPPLNPTTDPATRAEPSDDPSDNPSDDPSEVAVEHPGTRATEHADDGESDSSSRDAQPDGTGSVEPQTDERNDHPATSSPRTADHATSPTPSPTEQPDSHESPSTDDHSGSGSGFDSGSGPSTEER